MEQWKTEGAQDDRIKVRKKQEMQNKMPRGRNAGIDGGKGDTRREEWPQKQRERDKKTGVKKSSRIFFY